MFTKATFTKMAINYPKCLFLKIPDVHFFGVFFDLRARARARARRK